MYDIIIIGSGPAGLSAAIYAQRACLDTIVIEKNGISGGQVLNTWEVDNYPGFPGVTGFELSRQFREHANKLGARVVQDEVVQVELSGNVKKVVCEEETYEARCVILASGAHHRTLEVPGEEELRGAGVSYCATCDGAFFRKMQFFLRGCVKKYISSTAETSFAGQNGCRSAYRRLKILNLSGTVRRLRLKEMVRWRHCG